MDARKTEVADKEQSHCQSTRAACPACGAALIEIRGKLVCSACHQICETCCEGGRQ